MPDVRDLAVQMSAFEHVNKCTLALSITVTPSILSPDIVLHGTAHTKPDAPAEPALLASSHFSMKQLGFRTMDSAIMFALYQIDFLLAEHELNGNHKE